MLRENPQIHAAIERVTRHWAPRFANAEALRGGLTMQNVVCLAVTACGVLDDHFPRDRTTACRPGCAYCCAIQVAVTVPEVFYAIHVLAMLCDGDESSAEWQAVLTRAKTSAEASSGTVDADGYSASGAVCPLLDPATSLCVAYDARPLPCRGHAAIVPGECAQAGMGDRLWLDAQGAVLYTGLQSAIGAALYRYGQDPLETVRFNKALAVVLPDPDAAFDRWLAGDREVFAGCRLIALDEYDPRVTKEVFESWLTEPEGRSVAMTRTASR